MRILVVEDEIIARRGLVDLIHRVDTGHEIVGQAGGGEQGLAQMHALSPDLVFVDIQMPDMSGLEMIAEARRQELQTPFVIISAFAEFSYAQQALRLDVREYLVKPVTLEDMAHMLRRFAPPEPQNSASTAKHPMVARAIRYIASHYNEHLSLESISEKFQITPEYMSYLFRRDMGINFITYLRECRLSKACEMMEGGRVKVYEVAQAVGFSDAKYFCRVFKDSTGMSPGTYLKMQAASARRE